MGLFTLGLILNPPGERPLREPSPSAAERWLLPLEIKAGLSSVFGDFRENHLHSGVDFRTNGQIGYKVFATDDGVIYRLSVRKRGFGKAIYIRHGNGIESVYAHLDKFEEERLGLETFVKKAQRSRRTKYPGDLFLEKAVQRGQLIGFSGETGAGLPHLHFELRRGAGNPLDPFSIGLRYPDDTPPVIESVVIEPVGSESYLEGEHDPREYKFKKSAAGYTLPKIPTVSGKVQFRAAMYDQIGAENHCSVQAMQLSIDGEPFYRVNFDTFTFTTNHRVGLIYDFNKTRYFPAQFYYKLYNPYGHLPYTRSFDRSGGIWDTAQSPEGLHTLEIQAEDAAGHKAIATFEVKVAPGGEEKNAGTPRRKDAGTEKDSKHLRVAHAPPPGITVGLRDFGKFIEVVVLPNRPLEGLPEIFVQQQGGQKVQIPVRQGGEDRFVGTYDLIPGLDGRAEITISGTDLAGEGYQAQAVFLVQTIFARKGGQASWGENTFISFPPGSLYEDTFVNILPETDYQEETALPLASSVYGFNPRGMPLEREATVAIQYPAQIKDLKKLGVYRWDPLQNRWKYLDDTLNPQRRILSAEVNFLASYALLIDHALPVISDLQPSFGSKVQGSLPEVSAVIQDQGKGVDEASIVMELDGVVLDAEYDPDRNKAAFPLERPLKSGKHTLRVQASDLAGNKAVPVQSEFWVK